METLKILAGKSVIDAIKSKDGCKIITDSIRIGYQDKDITKIFSEYPNAPGRQYVKLSWYEKNIKKKQPINKLLTVPREIISTLIMILEDYFVYEFNRIIYGLIEDNGDWKRIIECFQNLGGNPEKLGMTVFPVNLLTRAHYYPELAKKITPERKKLYKDLQKYMSVDENDTIREISYWIKKDNFSLLETMSYFQDENWIMLSAFIYVYYSLKYKKLMISETKPNSKDINKEFSILNIVNILYPFNTLLNDAIGNKQYDIVKLLLEYGADPNIHGDLPLSNLWHAVYDGRVDIAELLLKHGADPNTDLHTAVFKNDINMVKLLLDYKADPNIQIMPERTSLLMVAVEDGSIPIIKLLLEKGADKNVKNINDKKAIDLTTDPEIIKLLR